MSVGSSRASESLGVLLIAMATLAVEILFVRVLDVILGANSGYLVITNALFGSGIAGAYLTLRPGRQDSEIGPVVAWVCVILAGWLALVRPAMNFAVSTYESIRGWPPGETLDLFGVYLALAPVFFLSGFALVYVFRARASQIRRLYFFDLVGAGIGCVVWVPFIRAIGPGGLLLWASAALLVAASLFAPAIAWRASYRAAAAGLFLVPLFLPGHMDFDGHLNKRGVLQAKREGRVEFAEWDPVSKIEVVDPFRPDAGNRPAEAAPKHLAYDGGSQSSTLFPFDGDLRELRRRLLDGSEPVERNFWNVGVLASHYLKRDTGATVLIFGSAAGQETKAALLFEPSKVDGVELVESVVKLGKGRYASFTGNIFNDPRVDNRAGEGRSFLRSGSRKYDILQIFSNHTSSNIAIGSGAVLPVYLQTVEAYQEYFTHLTPDGVLQINHHFYPRVLSTAAAAWRKLGRTDFQAHVVAYEMSGWDDLPTVLIKMSPWTPAELADLQVLFDLAPEDRRQHVVVDPLAPESARLPRELFSGLMPRDVLSRFPYRLAPATDDWPFFNNIQRTTVPVDSLTEAERASLDPPMLSALRTRQARLGGEYSGLVKSGAVGVMLGLALVVVPLRFASTSGSHPKGLIPLLGYFSCLGVAFIVIELAMVQIFMKVIGFPTYAFAVVIFSLLVSAGIGSAISWPFRADRAGRWFVPFVAIAVLGITDWLLRDWLFDVLLAYSLPVRVIAVAGIVFPFGLFMGMPFPMGIDVVRRSRENLIPWAWGMNALFSVVGGILAGTLALFSGFAFTILFACGIYLLAMAFLASLRRIMLEGVS